MGVQMVANEAAAPPFALYRGARTLWGATSVFALQAALIEALLASQMGLPMRLVAPFRQCRDNDQPLIMSTFRHQYELLDYKPASVDAADEFDRDQERIRPGHCWHGRCYGRQQHKVTGRCATWVILSFV